MRSMPITSLALFLALVLSATPVIANDCAEPADCAGAEDFPDCCESGCKQCRKWRCRMPRCCRVKICVVRSFGPPEAPRGGGVFNSIPVSTQTNVVGGSADRDLLMTLLLAQAFKNNSPAGSGSPAGGATPDDNNAKLQKQIDEIRADLNDLTKSTSELKDAVKNIADRLPEKKAGATDSDVDGDASRIRPRTGATKEMRTAARRSPPSFKDAVSAAGSSRR